MSTTRDRQDNPENDMSASAYARHVRDCVRLSVLPLRWPVFRKQREAEANQRHDAHLMVATDREFKLRVTLTNGITTPMFPPGMFDSYLTR